MGVGGLQPVVGRTSLSLDRGITGSAFCGPISNVQRRSSCWGHQCRGGTAACGKVLRNPCIPTSLHSCNGAAGIEDIVEQPRLNFQSSAQAVCPQAHEARADAAWLTALGLFGFGVLEGFRVDAIGDKGSGLVPPIFGQGIG